MTNPNPESPRSINTIAVAITRKHLGTPDNADAIQDEVVKEVRRLHSEGLLAEELPDYGRLLDKEIRRQVQGAAKGVNAQLKTALELGQSILTLGEDYDRTILVCGKKGLQSRGSAAGSGRWSTVGDLTDNDLTLISSESRRNRREVDAADDRLQEQVAGWVMTLRQYTSYRQMCERSAEAAS